jgi:DNA-binding NtrC family response regulator
MSIRVLLVDDSELFIEVLVIRLRNRGMTVSTVTSVKEFFHKLGEETFDVIVLDLIMPEMDGLEVLSILKIGKSKLPVLVYTADAASDRLKKAMDLGALDVIPKPTDLRILKRKIEVAESLHNKG